MKVKGAKTTVFESQPHSGLLRTNTQLPPRAGASKEEAWSYRIDLEWFCQPLSCHSLGRLMKAPGVGHSFLETGAEAAKVSGLHTGLPKGANPRQELRTYLPKGFLSNVVGWNPRDCRYSLMAILTFGVADPGAWCPSLPAAGAW